MAYLLDTNIISELRPQRRRISPFVQAWYDRVPDGELFLSVLVLGEIRAGIEALRSRDCQAAINLERWFGETIQRYRERTLPITAAIADR